MSFSLPLLSITLNGFKFSSNLHWSFDHRIGTNWTFKTPQTTDVNITLSIPKWLPPCPWYSRPQTSSSHCALRSICYIPRETPRYFHCDICLRAAFTSRFISFPRKGLRGSAACLELQLSYIYPVCVPRLSNPGESFDKRTESVGLFIWRNASLWYGSGVASYLQTYPSLYSIYTVSWAVRGWRGWQIHRFQRGNGRLVCWLGWLICLALDTSNTNWCTNIMHLEQRVLGPVVAAEATIWEPSQISADDNRSSRPLSIPHESSACVRAITPWTQKSAGHEWGFVPVPLRLQDDCMVDTPRGSIVTLDVLEIYTLQRN